MARSPESLAKHALYKKRWHALNKSRLSVEKKAAYLYKIGELNQRHQEFKKRLAELTPYDVGQIAAFVAGEGFIGLNRQTPNLHKNPRGRFYYNAMVGICNTAPELMVWLETKLGGRARWRAGIAPTGYTNAKRIGYWQVHGKCAAELCKVLLPHLVFKRKKAALVVEFFNGNDGTPGYELSDAECARRDLIYKRFEGLKRGRSL